MCKKLAVLGAGNMGCAICDGILKSAYIEPSDIILVRRNIDKISSYGDLGCCVCSDLIYAVKNADIILLAVKPHMLFDVLDEISPYCNGKLVVSIAAGTKISTIKAKLPECKIVRAMPNTPLTVGAGVTEICRDSDVSDCDFECAKGLFKGAGVVFECREEELNALTALTSSAVAYFALVEKAMRDWALENGLCEYDSQTVCDLVSKTAYGTSKLLFDNKISPESLIKAVASPRGTTEKALLVFEEKDLCGVFSQAMDACLKRAEELSSIK